MVHTHGITIGGAISQSVLEEIKEFLVGFKMDSVTVIIANATLKEDYWAADEYYQTMPFPGQDVFRAWNDYEDKTVIVFVDEAETDESIFWLIIHEIMHIEIRSGWLLLYSGLYREVEKKARKLDLSFGGYLNLIRRDDDLHESDPEEEICNRVATSLIGKDCGRKWWRSRKASKGVTPKACTAHQD